MIVDEFGVCSADTDASGGVAELLLVIGKEGVAPTNGLVAKGDVLKACAVHSGLRGKSCDVEPGGGEIDVENHVIDDFTFGEQTRIADDVGNA